MTYTARVVVVLMTLGIVVLGCGVPPRVTRLYSGFERPVAEISILTGEPGVRLISVDDRQMDYNKSWLFTGPYAADFEVHLLPGNHFVTFYFWMPGSGGQVGNLYIIKPAQGSLRTTYSLKFDALPGRAYQIRFTDRGPVVEELTSK
ncbi:MAG: hypothetical protein HY270_12605 [Deltaproteobacteria bacterium]|nr:hypothetical protein [Deltaproteobacteria bacterium]